MSEKFTKLGRDFRKVVSDVSENQTLRKLGGAIKGAAINKGSAIVRNRRIGGLAYGILDELLASFRSDHGYARPGRFEVAINPPSALKIGSSSSGSTSIEGAFSKLLSSNTENKDVMLRCHSITMPGRNLDTDPDTSLHGPTKQVVNGWSFAEITASFNMSNDLRERQFFERWQQTAFNEGTWSINYYNDYVGSLEIYQLDLQNRRRSGVKLFEAFPKTISGQQYDNAAFNQIQRLDVTFAYRYWESLDKEEPKRAFNERVEDRVRDVVERKILSKIPKVISKL